MPEIHAGIGERGVSVIVSTNKQGFMQNILCNFNRQRWANKELIIVLNNDLLNIEEWNKQVEDNDSISIYQLPESDSLGACLTFAVSKAKNDYIAKFDDDDYYAPCYLAEAMRVLRQTDADLVGKRSYYMYMIDSKLLMLRHPSREHRWSPRIGGGTIVGKKTVFQTVPFVNQKVGTAFRFVKDCHKKGFRIYSTSRFNYTYLRRDSKNHTWNPGIKYFLKTSKQVAVMSDYRNYVSQII